MTSPSQVRDAAANIARSFGPPNPTSTHPIDVALVGLCARIADEIMKIPQFLRKQNRIGADLRGEGLCFLPRHGGVAEKLTWWRRPKERSILELRTVKR